MARKTESSSNYSAENISVLEGLEPVRKRPGMYIGSTGPDGLHHLIKEFFDNSRDEAMNGHCDHIELALLPEGYVRVVDNGRGIPCLLYTSDTADDM
jgi:DNA gyrase subunit B